MNIITLDFETYFDEEFTLKKLTTEAYVRDPRFEVHGCGVKINGRGPEWYEGNKLFENYKHTTFWDDVGILCHHAHFDGLILEHHFGIRPAFWFDTLSMARLMLGNHFSVGLDSLARHFGLAGKTVPYEAFRGKHWSELSSATQQQLAAGCCHDIELTWTIFEKLSKNFPTEEYEVIDATIRMFTEPRLVADVDLLGKIWISERDRKRDLVAELQLDPRDLQSADKFAALLRAEGIEPSVKPGKNGDIYAFAKTDEFMRELLEHDDPRVRGLAEARLGLKSTITQSRAETLGNMASRGPLCAYLSYCAAHTTRWGGGDKSNFQNFGRGSDLRKSICAPSGHLLAIVDLSQIECRLLNYLAGQTNVIERFRNGEDPYVGIASQFYQRPITKDDKAERGTGKQLELSCGYGCGGPKFKRTAALGSYGPPVDLTDEQAKRAVGLYRATHPHVVAYWKEAELMIRRMNSGQTGEWGPMYVRGTRIHGPGGTFLIYDTLEWHIPDPAEAEFERVAAVPVDYRTADPHWRFLTRKGWQKLYGAKLVENVVQWLARIVISQALVRLKRLGLRPVMMSHDELVYVVPAGAALMYLEAIKQEMMATPEWAPGLPVDCEAALSERYEK